MSNLLSEYYIKPWEIYGGKRPFFAQYADMIGDVINEFKLKPMPKEVITPTLRVADYKSSELTSERIAAIDPSIYGGKKFAHFHYRGEIYKLNSKQWQAFAGRVKEDMVKKLQMANAISVQQFQELNDAIDSLG